VATLDYNTPVHDRPAYRASLHALAVLTATATLLLIFVGGLVTSHGAGMSVPDWPNSYGYNMFTFPVSKWVGGIFYEHTHRLLGTLVGFLSTLLVLNAWGTGQRPATRRWLWIAAGATAFAAACCMIQVIMLDRGAGSSPSVHNMLVQSAVGFAGIALVLVCATFMRTREPRRWVRWLTVAVLVAVIIQGILGGLRVVHVALNLAIVHACVAQACFCLMGLVCATTSIWWFTVPREHPDAGQRLIPMAAACVIVVYLQLIVGATMRHYQAGLAIPDFPTSYGNVLPPTDQAGLDRANQERIDLLLPPVTFSQIWLHFGHRIGAVIVTFLLLWEIIWILREYREPGLRRPAKTLVVLLVAQIALGIMTVVWQKPADVASSHVAVGALTLVTTAVLLIRSMRVFSPLWRSASRYLEIPVTPRQTSVAA
jgi:heme a synthase